MTFSKILNWLKWFIGALVVGGLGNGVWEKFLSPFLSFLSSSTINVLSEVSIKYSNKLYLSATNNLTQNSNVELSSGFVVLFLLMFIIFILSILDIDKKIALNKENCRFLLFSFLVFLIMIGIAVARDAYIYDIAAHSQKNLEIIRPYIGESEYLQLRSSYLQITTKKDFDIYEDKISKYSIKNNLNLRKFSN